jgi:hypothetical protein
VRRAQHICSICHEEFTRRYNGKRHNEKIHASQAEIIPLKQFRYGDIGYIPKKLGFLSSGNRQSKDEVLSTTLERIGKEFEACEKELELLSPQERAVLLAQMVVHSLRGEEPREVMNMFLKGIRKHRLNLKIIRCVSAGFEITPYAAKQMLMNMIE